MCVTTIRNISFGIESHCRASYRLIVMVIYLISLKTTQIHRQDAETQNTVCCLFFIGLFLRVFLCLVDWLVVFWCLVVFFVGLVVLLGFFLNVISLNSIYKLCGWWPGWVMVSSVSLFFHLLHMFPFGTTFVPLPPLLPVPHLFTVLIQAKAGAADKLDVVLVPQPGLCQQIPDPALLILSFLSDFHLPILNDI